MVHVEDEREGDPVVQLFAVKIRRSEVDCKPVQLQSQDARQFA